MNKFNRNAEEIRDAEEIMDDIGWELLIILVELKIINLTERWSMYLRMKNNHR